MMKEDKKKKNTALLDRYIQNNMFSPTDEMDEKALASVIKALLQESDHRPQNLN